MFVDFNRAFKNKPQATIDMPQALIDYLSKDLPSGVQYQKSDDGNLILIPNDEQMTIGGFIPVPSKEDLKVLGEKFSIDDLISYCYNAQKTIKLKLVKEGYITVNGKELPVDKLSYNPVSQIKYVSGSLCMVPPEFPENFPLTIEGDEHVIQLSIKRVPSKSVSLECFESSDNYPLVIKYQLDNKAQKFKLNISLKTEKANSIKDIVDSTIVYNAFIDGRGKFQGKEFEYSFNEDIKKFDLEIIRFWEKVLAVEAELGISFIPPKTDITYNTLYLVEKIFQSLINSVATRELTCIDSVDGEWKNKKEIKTIKDSIGHPMAFEFEYETKINLFGCEVIMPTLAVVYNSTFTKIEEREKKYTITIGDASANETKYMVTMYFKDKKSLEKYRDSNDFLNELKDAKQPEEYVS